MSQHTPGPYHYEPPSLTYPIAGHGHQVWPDQPGESRICTLVDGPNAEGNGLLLAAAPDLLAALEAAAERMESVAANIPVQNRAKGVSQATHVAHMAAHLAQHAKIARAAIAKAKGRE